MTITENVERGSVLLDQYVPGWADRIDVDNLVMTDPKACILGQLFDGVSDDFYTGYSYVYDHPEVVGLSPRRSSEYVGDLLAENGFVYSDDTESWKEAVAERKASTAGTISRYYDEATLLGLLDAGVSKDEFAAYIKVSKILSSM